MCVLAVAAVALATASHTGKARAAQAPPLELRYVANAGVLVNVDGRRILIDAPIRGGIPPYATSSPDERRVLEEARPPYDGIAAILITHWHEDHFSAEAIGAHLSRSPKTRLISSAEIVERVRRAAPAVPASQLVAVTPAPGAAIETAVDDRVRVHVLRIRHNDTRRMPEQHVGFLVRGTRTVLHVGDADPTPSNFEVLRGLPEIDLALLPFWYVLTPPNRAFVASSISPRRIVGMHLPPADGADVTRKLQGVNVILLTQPGTVIANLENLRPLSSVDRLTSRADHPTGHRIGNLQRAHHERGYGARGVVAGTGERHSNLARSDTRGAGADPAVAAQVGQTRRGTRCQVQDASGRARLPADTGRADAEGIRTDRAQAAVGRVGSEVLRNQPRPAVRGHQGCAGAP
jgi:L-ascorbate metabolism protein UlaG (beta-lactamase superfamily)